MKEAVAITVSEHGADGVVLEFEPQDDDVFAALFSDESQLFREELASLNRRIQLSRRAKLAA